MERLGKRGCQYLSSNMDIHRKVVLWYESLLMKINEWQMLLHAVICVTAHRFKVQIKLFCAVCVHHLELGL